MECAICGFYITDNILPSGTPICRVCTQEVVEQYYSTRYQEKCEVYGIDERGEPYDLEPVESMSGYDRDWS